MLIVLFGACASGPSSRTATPPVTDRPATNSTTPPPTVGDVGTTGDVPTEEDGRPADPKLKPAGVGWFCTSSSNSPAYKPCFRTRRECDEKVAANPVVFARCQSSPVAYCYTELHGSGYGARIKGTDLHEVVGWMPERQCSLTTAACASYTRARSVRHQRDDGPRSLHKEISRCTAWE